jgi:hypothetical protein
MGDKLLGAGMKGAYQMTRLSGLDPGLEFKVALEEADHIGANIVLGRGGLLVLYSRLYTYPI